MALRLRHSPDLIRLPRSSSVFRLTAALTAALLFAAPSVAADDKPGPTATPAESLKVAKDFKVELLYSVPKDREGSWVNLCVDPKGRLVTSDQYGPLYRITPPPIGGKPSETKVEKLPIDIGEAQGLLFAFDSLYVVVNKGKKYETGLYRVPYNAKDDTFGPVRQLRKLNGAGEHGPHAVLPHPDGKHIVVVCGDGTKLTEFTSTRVPKHWGEDHILPRMPDGRGFMAGVLGPGGAMYIVDPDGKDWELFSVGYRNQFDAAFNRHGELFTYDADMEWDINTPWYRPTRVCLVTSGSEFGWRNGAGKWPPYYPDSVPAIYDVGPGSPTGMCFGYGAKFPAKYQEALYMCDWSYGKLYAAHLKPHQSSYSVDLEEFINGSPLPLTDVVINPKDGALYFTIGGRQVQSGLYRVTYVGKESTAPLRLLDEGTGNHPERDLRILRHKLEAFHGKKDPKAVETAWPYLDHADRFIRSAARIALEHQDPKEWTDRALAEKEPAKALGALLALVRVSSSDPQHAGKEWKVDEKLKAKLLDALQQVAWDKLTDDQRLDLMRIYAILFVRMGPPDAAAREKVLAKLDSHFPATNRFLNADLCQLLVYLEAPKVIDRSLKLMAEAPTQEEQMEYARSLRMARTGWTPEQRKTYFSWYLKAANFRGGNSLEGFLTRMKSDALATCSDDEKKALAPILDAKPVIGPVVFGPPRDLVKKWKMDDLAPLFATKLTGRDFDRGRKLFGEAKCFACHRFANEGGSMGPDLTQASGRFSARDLLESVLDPSKEISDQYAAVIITTDAQTYVGRIVNLHGDTIHLMTDMLDPNKQTPINRKRVESIKPSKVSPMPEGLLDTFKEDEILDLMAYLLSRGDRNNAMFQKAK
jgi:putative heme-binding domain-containing protein